MSILRVCLSFVVCFVSATASAQQAARAAGKQKLTLEKLFPEKGLFGPSASAAAFSHDGRHGAWLHRPFAERRHGPDLWLYETESGAVRQVTSVEKMVRFQESSRKVQDAKKEKLEGFLQGLFGGGEKKAQEQQRGGRSRGGQGEEGEAEEDDGDNGPRYSGISAFTWSPKADELLFVSEGDVYRWRVGGDEPERLTMTREQEYDVQYLPDGSGYTFLRGGGRGGPRRRGGGSGGGESGGSSALIKVEFGSHLIAQLDPKLPDGESMSGYRFSEDGKRVVFLARKGDSPRSGNRTVNIAQYRERFMEVNQVPRHVSDDPIPETEISIYLYEFTEPMAENGTLAKVHSFKVDNPRDTYRVPNWSPDSSKIVFAVFKHDSGQVHVMQAQAPKKGGKAGGKSGKAKDEAASVVHRFLHTGGPTTPPMIQPFYLADNRHIVFLSEQSGFRHLHVLDPVYESVRALTSGTFEVYPIDPSKDRRFVYVTATKEDMACQDVYRVDVESGRMERLTRERGVYDDVAVSPDGATLLANFACFGKGQELVAVRGDGQQALTDSHPKATAELVAARPEFFSYANRHGHTIFGYLFKPADWTPADRRPLIVYVYGGPLGTRKNVVEGSYGGDGYLFARYMTETHGYVTCTIDPRGMSGYGGVFEKANYEQVGKPQVEDLVDGVKFLVEHHGVDEKRVGIHGWSFGGFQTQMCLYTEPKVFACGIAGAGPTEWQNYNSWYSLGTIGPSRTGKPDLEKFSLLPLAKNLRGRLLLVHGMEDANVLYQDTVRVYRELLKAGKETLVELFLDPTGGHGLGGDVKRLNKARKYEEFFVRNLGEGKAAEIEDPTLAQRRVIVR
jgi:dipeptidyl aminopeptidase/acylaminoacyl peptidase